MSGSGAHERRIVGALWLAENLATLLGLVLPRPARQAAPRPRRQARLLSAAGDAQLRARRRRQGREGTLYGDGAPRVTRARAVETG